LPIGGILFIGGCGLDLDETASLKGNTLRVYWTLLKSETGIMGVREVQRALKFSSPTLAAYHLRKLEELGLVKNERGDYRLIKEVKVGVLQEFMRLGAVMLPRYTLYATMFTALLAFYLLQFKEISFYSVSALIFVLLPTAIFWYETLRVWQQRP